MQYLSKTCNILNLFLKCLVFVLMLFPLLQYHGFLELYLAYSRFCWQMVRAVGGALLVRMFPHMFPIPTPVSVVSLSVYTGVAYVMHHIPVLNPGGVVCWGSVQSYHDLKAARVCKTIAVLPSTWPTGPFDKDLAHSSGDGPSVFLCQPSSCCL